MVSSRLLSYLAACAQAINQASAITLESTSKFHSFISGLSVKSNQVLATEIKEKGVLDSILNSTISYAQEGPPVSDLHFVSDSKAYSVSPAGGVLYEVEFAKETAKSTKHSIQGELINNVAVDAGRVLVSSFQNIHSGTPVSHIWEFENGAFNKVHELAGILKAFAISKDRKSLVGVLYFGSRSEERILFVEKLDNDFIITPKKFIKVLGYSASHAK